MGLSVIAGVSVARLDAAGVVDAPRDTSTSQPGDEYLAEVPEILVLRGLIADGVREVQALLQAQRRTEARCRLQKKKVLELRLHELLRKEGRRRREEACSLSRASNLSSGSSGGSFAGDDACSDSSAASVCDESVGYCNGDAGSDWGFDGPANRKGGDRTPAITAFVLAACLVAVPLLSRRSVGAA